MIGIEPAKGRGGGSVDGLGGEDVFHRAGFVGHLREELLAASAGEDAEAVFEKADGGIGAGEAHVHLQHDFVAGAEGTAVAFGDEDRFRQVLEVARDGDVGADGLLFPGEQGWVDALDVAVHQEEVRVGGIENDDFGGWGGAVGGDQRLEEGEHILEEVIVEEVYRWVGDDYAGYIAVGEEGEGTVWGGRWWGDVV